MMSKGRVLEILEQEHLSHKMKKNIYLATNDNLRMQDILEEEGVNYQVDKDYLVLDGEKEPMDIIQMVLGANLEVHEIFYQKIHFEDYYLEQIGGEK